MRNIKKSDILLYLISVALCLLTYIILAENIKASLFLHQAFIGFLYSFTFEFVPNIGYQETNGLFIIAQSCLGHKLFASLFLILTFGFLQEYKTLSHKIIAAILFYFSSIILSFMITIIRIALSIPFCNFAEFTLIHNTISLGVYFISGFILYHLMENRRNFVCKSY